MLGIEERYNHQLKMKPSINRSIVKIHSKRWKQKNWLKQIIERLQDLLSVKNYIDLEIKNEKNLQMFQLEQRKLNLNVH